MARGNCTSCPICNRAWTFDEIDEQTCMACGYDEDEDDPGDTEPNEPEPDLMGKDYREEAEEMHRIQRDLK